MSSLERKTTERMKHLNDVLRPVGDRFRKGTSRAPGGEVVDWNDPFEELARREDLAIADAKMAAAGAAARFIGLDVDDIPPELREVIEAAALEQFIQYENTLIEWFFAPGPHPLEVMRRLFAYVKQKRASLLWNMGFRDLGELLGESYENMRLRCETLFRGIPAGWKKNAEACDRMAESALGNRNRKGGHKLLPKDQQRALALEKSLKKTTPRKRPKR